MSTQEFDAAAVIQFLISNGINTPDAIEAFGLALFDAAQAFQQSMLQAKRAQITLPDGQILSSIGLANAGYPDCPTSLGSLYTVIDSGKGSQLSEEDFDGMDLDPGQQRNLRAAIAQDSLDPLGWE